MMFERLSINICDQLINNRYIEPERRALYEYGVQQGLFLVLNLIIQFIIGIAFGTVLEAIVLLASYMFLRVYTGGYHAKTQLGCFLVSTILFVLALSSICMVVLNAWFIFGIILISGIVIYKFSPFEAINRPLNAAEKLEFKKRSKIIWLLESLIMSISFYFGLFPLVKGIFNGLLLVNIMIVLGIIESKSKVII